MITSAALTLRMEGLKHSAVNGSPKNASEDGIAVEKKFDEAATVLAEATETTVPAPRNPVVR